MLPVQQSFATYFILTAFAPIFQVEPSLVGMGRPFELLQLAGLVQVGAYFFAAILHFTDLLLPGPEDFTKLAGKYGAVVVPPASAPSADECVVCLGSCEDCQSHCETEACLQDWWRLKCGHHFHARCIGAWLRK